MSVFCPGNAAMSEMHVDDALKGNEKIEEYIAMLQKEPTPELLSVVLTAVRRRMRAGGQMIVAVDTGGSQDLQVQVMQLENGEKWLPAFTSFEEQMMGKSGVMSAFLADIGQLLDMALNEEGVQGLLINPWNRTLKLDKHLIRIIKGVS